jgi:hypothetical protein
MKKKKEKKKEKKYDPRPVVLGQKDLSEYADHPYFKKKAAEMDELISKVGLPKEWE